jgi:hypothetical protein
MAHERAREAREQLNAHRGQTASSPGLGGEQTAGGAPPSWPGPAGEASGDLLGDENALDDELTDANGMAADQGEFLPSDADLGMENDGGAEESSFDADLTYEDYDDEESFLSSMSGTAQRRRELDRERADRELELGDESFWLVCPKCGEFLAEHEFDNIKVERCESCGVVTIDKGEIELLMSSEEDRAVAYRIKGLLR